MCMIIVAAVELVIISRDCKEVMVKFYSAFSVVKKLESYLAAT